MTDEETPKTKAWASGSACRSRSQTTRSCLDKESRWWTYLVKRLYL